MAWSTGFLLFLFVFNYFESGTPALTKAGLEQTKVMMKNLCKRSSGVSQESLNQFKAQIFPDDPKLKCYFRCCLGMMKTMKKDKITVADATKQIELLLPEEMREASLKQLNACKDSAISLMNRSRSLTFQTQLPSPEYCIRNGQPEAPI